jgi:Domain of unknown function (DUF4326)
MSNPTKNPPPLRIKRRQPAPPPAPPFEITSPPAPPPRPPSRLLQDPEPFQAPVGPARVRLDRRTKAVAVNITRPPWSCPFRIVENDPDNRQGPCTIVWVRRGVGTLRAAPSDFEPIACTNRRLAQELILILFRDWLTDPARSNLLEQARTELHGKTLACHCGFGTPCHGDVLLELTT